MFKVDFGVRQGSVLSPYLFSINMDDLDKLCQYNRGITIVLYADLNLNLNDVDLRAPKS